MNKHSDKQETQKDESRISLLIPTHIMVCVCSLAMAGAVHNWRGMVNRKMPEGYMLLKGGTFHYKYERPTGSVCILTYGSALAARHAAWANVKTKIGGGKVYVPVEE